MLGLWESSLPSSSNCRFGKLRWEYLIALCWVFLGDLHLPSTCLSFCLGGGEWLLSLWLDSSPFLQQPNTDGIWELMTGGAFYCLGMVFFKSDGRIPFAHAIWHLFVAFGAGTHYYAIWRYLYLPSTLQTKVSKWVAQTPWVIWTLGSKQHGKWTVPRSACLFLDGILHGSKEPFSDNKTTFWIPNKEENI